MFPALFAFAGQIGGWIFDSVKQSREIKAAAAENTVRLLKDEQSNNHAWEMANLQDKDKGLRWVSFGLFAGPMVWALFDPVGVKEYFTLFKEVMPDWYQQIVFSMVGGIWGVSALKNVVPSIVSQTIKSITDRTATGQ